MRTLNLPCVFFVILMLFVLLVNGLVGARAQNNSAEFATTHNSFLAPQKCGLGRTWVTGEVNWFGNWGWQGVWTRRGDSNTFDATWTRRADGVQLKDVVTVTIQGTSVYVSRPSCEYRGTFQN